MDYFKHENWAETLSGANLNRFKHGRLRGVS